MKINCINSYGVANKNINKRTSFKGAGSEIISEGFKEFVSDALPLYKTARCLNKIGNGDSRGAVKQGVGVADNILLQPAKQALATTMAAKGAAIGTMLCPGFGTALGAGVGYLGTLFCWGKARNTVVDAIMD